MGSMSRYLRTWLSLQDCASQPWPPYDWSPGHTQASTQPPPRSLRAPKPAENLLGCLVLPMLQLAQPLDPAGGYATQVLVRHDATDRIYYYRTHQGSMWYSVDLKAPQGTAEPRAFPLGQSDVPFSIDVTHSPKESSGAPLGK
jgi:hypothetical protein